MPLQDLTPQLRTRLSRLERVVGVFVIVATALMVSGFVYYVYYTAERKGWFLTKAPYFTFVRTAGGLNVGDPVKMMGFDVGTIMRVEAMPPEDQYFNVYIEFRIRSPYYGYLWTDSRAKVGASDFLGHRYIEVTKGTNGTPTYKEVDKKLVGIWHDTEGGYLPITKTTKPYWLLSDESPALTERLEALVNQAERALPGILNLTNQLADVLTNSTRLIVHANQVITNARPVITNLALLSAQLRESKGALGEWLLPTNINQSLDQTLLTANTTLAHTDTNLSLLISNLSRSLDSLADITSNLNAQVQVNTNILSSISRVITNADDFVQGLKRHWLLRSAFRPAATNAPRSRPPPPRNPKIWP
ncbi:MAG: MlaD family protein [Limisphaerales bacterium]